MAPISLGSDQQDDDFIRTISDDDVALPESSESDSEPAASSTQPLPSSKKRKLEEYSKETRHNGQTHKKQKKTSRKVSSRSKVQAVDASSDDEEDARDWTAGGEHDGAIDPDFEFVVQGTENGLTQVFNGWDTDITDQKDKHKKSVDVDELIARRREKPKSLANDQEQAQDDEEPDVSIMSENLEVSGENLDSESESADGMLESAEDDENLADDAFGMGAIGAHDEDADQEKFEMEEGESGTESETVADEMPEPSEKDSASEDEGYDPSEKARQDSFFAPEIASSKTNNSTTALKSFQTFSLSRPILRGLTAAGFTQPTPIQSRTIPTALMGKDVVGGAVTGSGKTAAFIIPILERLLYRPKRIPTSRVAIFTPTRELATQCFEVARKLASYSDITFCQLVGGLSLREQENILRKRPDVIIATPGRFIDHMRNSPSFTIDTLEILVLDEADRMLEEGFADELNEILTTIPKSRQTMLFSATMTDKVDKLIRVGLKKPVRIMVDARKQTVGTLTQEFVRLRPGKEGLRLGFLAYLCSEVFTNRVIIFFRQKKEVHRVRVIFGLLGIKATELHGSMTQEQRISAITSFSTHKSTHLLATDLASRGLDIPAVSTVLNYSVPQTHEIYLHRVGRTARAGRTGRSCTLAAEEDRKIVKAVVRTARAQGAKIISRLIPSGEGEKWRDRIEGMEGDVEAVLTEEKEEKAMRGQEMMVKKGENLLEYEEEIKGRDKRTWFVSGKEKEQARKKGWEELNGGEAGGKKKEKKGGRLSGKEKKRRDDHRERVEGKMWKKGKGDADMATSNGKNGARGKPSKGKREKQGPGKGNTKKGQARR